MRRAAVSFAAVIVLMASFATPNFAAEDTTSVNNDVFAARLSMPDVVQAGTTFTARGSITLHSDGTQSRKMVAYLIDFEGMGQQRSGFRAFPTGRTKTMAKTFTVPTQVEAGEYTVTIAIQVEGVNALLSKTFTVVK